MSPPPEEVPLIDLSPFSLAPASPALHPWQSTEISPSPSPRDSPPPRYPGSPHSSDDYYMAEELSELTSILQRPAGDDHISRLAVLRVEDAGTSSEQPLPTSIAHELVPESHPVYSATSPDYPVGTDTPAFEDAALPDECILQSLVFHTSCVVERYCTFLHLSGEIYVKIMPLPDYHYLNPAFQDLHQAALEDAIRERSAETGAWHSKVERMMTWDPLKHPDACAGLARHQHGFLDTDPSLMPDRIYHEQLIRQDPEMDDETALPGFRSQLLAQHVGHLANIRCPRGGASHASPTEVGLMDQPNWSSKQLVCLSAIVKIGSSAYVLFDSGSNMDLVTPEYANTVDGPRIPLDE
ncbi:hypothetical protein C8J57DRAFT_1247941 [Mycena rebaudengoi]|nr:hypothetical protein C8J57DRAFT_1247941 [Mycena rebaudengoi]